jgi:glycosyltransferase involved in cell wall biosynthesis
MARQKLVIEASAIADKQPSGVGYSIINFIDALSSNASIANVYDIHIIVPSRRLQFAKDNISTENITIRHNYLQNRIVNLLNYLGLLPHMDKIYGQGLYLFPNYKNWPLTKKSKSMTIIHDLAFLLYPDTVEPKNQAMLAKNVPRWIYRTDKVITVSNNSKQEIIKNLSIDAERVATLYNIVPSLKTLPTHEKVLEVRERYHLPERYLLILSTIEPRKNLSQLLDVYDALGDAFKAAYPLVICGGIGWERPAVIERMEQGIRDGWIVRPGYVKEEDKPSLYAGAKLFIHPAIHEGFGLPPLEALQSGTAVLANNIPVLREVLGDAVTYADFSDVAATVALLREMIERAVKPNQQTVAGILERYSPDSVVSAFCSIVEEL